MSGLDWVEASVSDLAGCSKMDAGVVSDFRPQAFAARTAAERVQGPGAQLPGTYLKILGCRSQRDRRSRKPRRSSPMRNASPSSRILAFDTEALATPLHTLFQQPA